VPHKINFGAVEGENRGSDPMPTPIERIDKCVEPTLPVKGVVWTDSRVGGELYMCEPHLRGIKPRQRRMQRTICACRGATACIACNMQPHDL
jgi:hypothetical protein